jgi:hypothetical protein
MGKIFENLFKIPLSQKVLIYLQGDLMAIKKIHFDFLHVFMCDILANMTQVSDVAPGPLV